MSFFSTLQDWEYLAKKDALWAILSDPRKKDGRWSLDEFFAHGQMEIDRTLRYLERQRLLPVDFASAVDFGCGVGRLSRALAGRFAAVYGVDASPTMIARGRELNRDKPNLELVLNQEPRLSRFADDSISFVYTTLVLQHITYPESLGYVRELLRIVKPGGVVMLQTPTLDRTPMPLQLVRAGLRTVIRRARLPVGGGWYMDMNTIPTHEIEAAARERGCEIVARFNINHRDIGADGELAEGRAPLFERLVSERFVVRKKS
jgi:SAM-dependent methyltransferase